MQIHYKDAIRVAARAMANGATRTGLTSLDWDLAPRCHAPRRVEIIGRPPPGTRIEWRYGRIRELTLRDTHVKEGNPLPVFIDMHVKCRGCPQCLKERSAMWRARAVNEYRDAARTWFCTLTFRPEVQHLILSEARQAEAEQGIDFETLTERDQFTALAKQAGKRLTLFLKRVRKSTGAPIRYIAVAENHKSGLPHLHMLVHERSEDAPVLHKDLTKHWTWGFSKFKLMQDTKSCSYVTKYLNKSKLARVRASLRYGKLDHEQSHVLKHSEQRGNPTTLNPPMKGTDHGSCRQSVSDHGTRNMGRGAELSVKPPQEPTQSCERQSNAAKAQSIAEAVEAVFAVEAVRITSKRQPAKTARSYVDFATPARASREASSRLSSMAGRKARLRSMANDTRGDRSKPPEH